MKNEKCKSGHLGSFVYAGDHNFVSLTCQSCGQETQRLSAQKVADLLNEIVTLPMHRKVYSA